MVEYGEILENKVDSDIIAESFETGKEMLGKYAGLSEIMGMSADEFTDMKKLYNLAMSFKEQAIKAINQQNQQSEMLYDLTETVKELSHKVSLLQEDLDSLKSKAKNND